MQENINIPDSEITTNLSFRQLVLMNMQQLTNFPYIEKDFDALTDYELLCLVVKYLNDVITNQNEQNASITRMYNSFLALQEYVNNTKDDLVTAFNNLDNYVRYYFDNLDVQEEINNKLDQMVEDGTLEEIIAKYIDTKLSIYDSISSMENNTTIGEMFKLKGYDTTFITTTTSTISSLQINDTLYADVLTKSVIIDSLGITSTIDPVLFAEIVEYVRNKGIEIVFDHKTYTLNGTITLTSANKLKLSGLGYDSVIDYTGNDYAFIINKLQQAQLYNFTINCVNEGGGIYCKYATGQQNTNNLTSSSFKRVYINNSKNPFKNDCHCGYVLFDECVFDVGTVDGIGVDFSDAYYPEFVTIQNSSIRTTKYVDTNNTAKGIYFTSGLMLTIQNNDIIGFDTALHINASTTTENMRTINLLNNSYWDCLHKAVYIQGNTSNPIKNLTINNSTVTSSKRNTTIDNAFHIIGVNGISIENCSITVYTNSEVFISSSTMGNVKNVYSTHEPTQSNNQIGGNINYEYTNRIQTPTVPANGSINVEIGDVRNLINFHNYILTRRGANNSTTGLTLSNQSISNGKITFTLTNTTSENIALVVYGI